MDFTKEEQEMIHNFLEQGDRYAFDVWDFFNNKKDGENIIDYILRQEVTDSKILEFLKSTNEA